MNKIGQPYKISVEENKIISNNFTTHNDWDKPIFNELKKNIKDDLRPKQNNKCCYCKKELGYDIKDVDIEHIIPKAQYFNFTFEPLNLALSCPACNTKKGERKVLSKKIKHYPKKSQNFLIVHAHYDDYDKHIEIHSGCIFEGLTKKGCRTIEVCELFRLKNVEKNAKKILAARTKHKNIIDIIKNTNKEELRDILAEIVKIL